MNPPANWYPDPTGRHDQRYWDGEQWTEHVFTDGVQAVDPLEQAAAAADEAHAAAGSGDEETDVASGLFEDANGSEHVDGQGVWGAQDEVGGESATEDVPAADADAPPAVADMSDAFVLAPETASRIVKRRAAEAAEQARAAEAAAPEPAAAAPDTDEAAGIATGDTDDHAPPADQVPTTDAAPTADAPPTEDAAPATDDAAPATEDEAPESTLGGEEESGDLGITGDLLGDALTDGTGAVALQNSRLLRCSVTPGDAVVARPGTVVAHRGDVAFAAQEAGDGPAMLRAEGSGDVFFADRAQHVHILQLAGGPGLSVNGRNVLAFSATLASDTQRVGDASLLDGDLSTTTFTGTGWVALISDGEPVVLHTDEDPTHVDVNALVGWSAGLSTRVTDSLPTRSGADRGSGEAYHMVFDGPGIVIVQPSEGAPGAATPS